MQIIIIGCGKVGRTLAEQLQEEESDITLVDVSSTVINSLQDDIDAMGIIGNGASINTLMEAGLENADILIAVTGSDEMNLLCCLIAQKTGHCQTIARVRNPIYGKEIAFIKERLGVTMIINPELAAAQEISRLLRFPSAIKIDTFAKGHVELLKFKVLPEFDLDGMTISRITILPQTIFFSMYVPCRTVSEAISKLFIISWITKLKHWSLPSARIHR